MTNQLEYIFQKLFETDPETDTALIFDPKMQFNENAEGPIDMVKSLNAAFLITLAGNKHRDFNRAENYIRRLRRSSRWNDLAEGYANGKNIIYSEIQRACKQDPEFAARIVNLYKWLRYPEERNAQDRSIEKIWSVFFPEGTGILENRDESVQKLRQKRIVHISNLNPFPLTEPSRQILFTSNVLLTVPDKALAPEKLALTCDLRQKISDVVREEQAYWYDHPIQIGVGTAQNEVFYGLRGLDAAVKFERDRGNVRGDKITCVLSVSVTHHGLQGLAKKYLEEEISRTQGFNNINIYVFTEIDTESIIQDILIPAAEHYLEMRNAGGVLEIFGVDGEYGRHYSFLKAISAFWNILIDSEIQATFKIDLDQVFPQKELVEQTKASAFEHFKTPLWGALGRDADGQPVELGLIAGTLINQKDLKGSLFIPDVLFPQKTLTPEEKIFFSALPQALSTEAEMMTRYQTDCPDGIGTCIQRIHVTGGTNGILIDSLRKHRPFTPSFIGRAEDQAYILSVLRKQGERLAYVHKDGLIMRHDKEEFAQDAIKASSSGKLVGDYIRTLFFSKYTRVLSNDISKIKRTVDPFTGCFISNIPIAVVFLRFCLRAASLFSSHKNDQGVEFVTMGIQRIYKALEFVDDEKDLLKKCYEKESMGWNLYYDILDAVEKGLKNNDPFATNLRAKAADIIRNCLISDNAHISSET